MEEKEVNEHLRRVVRNLDIATRKLTDLQILESCESASTQLVERLRDYSTRLDQAVADIEAVHGDR